MPDGAPGSQRVRPILLANKCHQFHEENARETARNFHTTCSGLDRGGERIRLPASDGRCVLMSERQRPLPRPNQLPVRMDVFFPHRLRNQVAAIPPRIREG